jgi:hypothetical protein
MPVEELVDALVEDRRAGVNVPLLAGKRGGEPVGVPTVGEEGVDAYDGGGGGFPGRGW